MEKIKKIFIVFLFLFIVTGCSLFTDTWVYDDLPYDYAIQKTGETTMVIGKYIDDLLEIKNGKKIIGFEAYVTEFQHGDRYIGFKCAKSADESIEVFFYIIDAKNEDVYGSYETESEYEAVKSRIVDEELGEWIKTSTISE